MNIQRYILPASIAATLHVALLFGFHKEPGPFIRILEVPLLPPLVKQPEEPVVLPPEEKNSTEVVKPLGGGPRPPDIDLPPAKPKPDSIPVPADERRQNYTTELKIIPANLGPGDIGSPGPGEWKGIARMDDLDRIPRATVQIPPDYPATMRQYGVNGSVTVEFDVDTDGRVVRAEAVRYTHREFAEPAVRAVLKWHFEPGRRHGRAVPFRMAIPIEFGLAVD